MLTYTTFYQSAVGSIKIVVTDKKVQSVSFQEKADNFLNDTHFLLTEVVHQLDEYFEGKRHEFDLPLAPQDTPFQKKVWNQLRQIPYGKTASYSDIAKAVGNGKAVRAVGAANKKNPIAIIIPCHRVIGSNGKLTGYAGGLWRKERLLKHEKNIL
ncbi:MAG: methylated-DNA--[protein]-cysteine S-methyltransferase [Calditrichales bacterium]|nr:methylated-DNA--[protein]-cysteine S-methyltransferase [Calditrichales bacterium]